jgi:hypothetical protein
MCEYSDLRSTLHSQGALKIKYNKNHRLQVIGIFKVLILEIICTIIRSITETILEK